MFVDKFKCIDNLNEIIGPSVYNHTMCLRRRTVSLQSYVRNE